MYYGGYYPYYGYGMGMNSAYLLATILVFAAAIFAIIAQGKVSSTFNKYSKIANNRGYTGEEVARQLLYNAGIYDVTVERISGSLTDHYDPTHKVLRLSDPVFSSRSVAALSVAAHETGHAIQHNTGYIPLKLRSNIFPAVNFSSRLAMPLLIIGLLIGSFSGSFVIAMVGAILYSVVVLFQLVTLPVEFNASARALKNLKAYGYLDESEVPGARKVLTAAALTYVAAAASAFATLLRLLAIIMGNSRRGD